MKYKIEGAKPLDEITILQRVAEMDAERYSKSGDYSVTDLINPPRVVHLKKRYGDVVKAPLEGAVASMMGTSLHEFFEKYLSLWCDKHDYDGYALEEQVLVERQGRKISGRYDIREGDQLYDLKTIKTWKLVFDPNFEDFHQQQNLYRLLIKLDKGIDIKGLNIIAVYKDWQVGNALRDSSYPQHQAIEYELNLWDYEEIEKFLDHKLGVLISCEEEKDDDLPLCSRDERWERHPGGETVHFAILKDKKAKRATKVIKGGTLDEALVVARGMKGMSAESLIEVRYAVPKRCKTYCEINEYCSFWKYWNKSEGKVDEKIKFKV